MSSSPTRLRTEYARNPLGIDTDRPRFGWSLPPDGPDGQSGYRVLVASSPDALTPGDADVWDSGDREGGARTNVRYEGPPLRSRTRYHWTVRIRDGDGEWTAWADPAWFETGLDPADWAGEWIADEADPDPAAERESPSPAPAFRTEFALDARPVDARLHVAGVGKHEAALNGDRVGDGVLEPELTDFDERVLYTTHDVTDALREGENALGVVLGRGRYALTTGNVWAWDDPPWWSPRPHLRVHLEVDLADGTTREVGTDDGWRVTDAATRFDSIYAGERYDARRARELGAWREPGYDDADWDGAAAVRGPDGDEVARAVQPMRVVDTHEPDAIERLDDGTHVVDFGTMTAGWVELAVEGEAGTEVTLIYGEKCHDDGHVDVDQGHVDDDIQTDTYVLAGDGVERWEPRFSYKGFRYVEVEGYPGDLDPAAITAKTIHTNLEAGSESQFACSDDLLTRIHGNARRAILNNHHGIPTDTPVYEKNGWTGDAQLTAEAALYNFDMPRFYRKWLADFADARRESGEVPPIVPTSDWGYSDAPKDGGITGPLPAWDAAYVLVPWWTYRYAGDERLLREHYDWMCDLVEFIGGHAEGHVVDLGLGDWLAPAGDETADPEPLPPEGPAITSTAYYYRLAEVVADVAGLLGFEDDRRTYDALADGIRRSFNDRFLDPDDGVYRTGEAEGYRQTSNVFPLAFDLVPDGHRDAVVENLVADVVETRDGHLDTGILGTKYLLPVLTEAGHLDVAYEVATQRDYPSWGNWIENGAAALYEAWELTSRTRDHHMFGSIDDWCYGYLAGVRPAEPGFERVEIAPHVPAALDAVRATVDTVRGPVGVEWEDGDALSLSVSIPADTPATVRVPGRSDGATIDAPDDAAVDAAGDRWACAVGGGEWTFEVS